MKRRRKIYRVKTIPQTNGIIEADVNYLHIHSYQRRDIKVYNKVKSEPIISNANAYL